MEQLADGAFPVHQRGEAGHARVARDVDARAVADQDVSHGAVPARRAADGGGRGRGRGCEQSHRWTRGGGHRRAARGSADAQPQELLDQTSLAIQLGAREVFERGTGRGCVSRTGCTGAGRNAAGPREGADAVGSGRWW